MRAFVLALVLSLGILFPALSVNAAAPVPYPADDTMTWGIEQIDAYYLTLFALQGQADQYVSPTVLILPEGQTAYTGCGNGSGAMIAFYCPADQTIVISEEFVAALAEEDDFLPLYVLAHEWAHHATALSGTDSVYRPEDGDWDQVYIIENELRADCLAGAWMGSVEERGYLNATDMSAVLIKASEIGDPGIFGRGSSHGTGAERLRAVFLGYTEGIFACMAITPLDREGVGSTVTLPPLDGPNA